MKQCIENPNDVNWAGYWAERLAGKVNKNWDDAAPGFYKRTRKEDYNTALFDKLILDENDTVLDVGCGEGSVTVPLAKRVKKVIGIDSSPKMLEYLEKRATENNIDNIETILKPIEEITYEEIGDVDVVVCSRSLNAIIPIEETIAELNKIANMTNANTIIFIIYSIFSNYSLYTALHQRMMKRMPAERRPGPKPQ